ncbi:MAG: GumC family protein [Candidatus Acidiferrales bacterium]
MKVTQDVAKPEHELVIRRELPENLEPLVHPGQTRERIIAKLRLIWLERKFLYRLVAAGFALTTLVAFLTPARYSSTAQLMPPDSEANSGLALAAELAGQGGIGGLAGDLLGMKSTGALFVGVLGSRTVEDRIVERFDLKKVYRVRLEQAARQKLAESTGISEDRKSGIISLTVTDGDPKRAAAIAGAYVEELDTLMAQLTTSSAHREREFLEQRLEAVKQDLDSAEENFSQFASKNGMIDITEQGKAMVGSAATLEGQLVAAESELEGLKQIYTDSNVRVRTVQARIAELRHQLGVLSGGGAPPSAGDAATSDNTYPTLRQLPILGVPYADLYRRLTIEETVYETLTKQYELAKVEEAKEIPTVKVLDSAEVPEKKSYPPRLFMIVLGTLGTLALGIMSVIGKSRWQEIDSQDPTKLFLEEIFHEVSARMPWVSTNGNSPRFPI